MPDVVDSNSQKPTIITDKLDRLPTSWIHWWGTLCQPRNCIWPQTGIMLNAIISLSRPSIQILTFRLRLPNSVPRSCNNHAVPIPFGVPSNACPSGASIPNSNPGNGKDGRALGFPCGWCLRMMYTMTLALTALLTWSCPMNCSILPSPVARLR